MLRRQLLRPFRTSRHLRRAFELARATAAAEAHPSSAVRVDSPRSDSPRTAAWLPLYKSDQKQPYTVAGACGPWTVSTSGGVQYDCGGYGMNGWGHNDAQLLDAVAAPQCQANLMTHVRVQDEFATQMTAHVGERHLACLNSGSEAVTLALRIANTHSRPNAVVMHLQDSFHGRTDAAAAISDSTRDIYRDSLARYDGGTRDPMSMVRCVTPNNLSSLHTAFDECRRRGEFVEAFVMEGVMGEGRPAVAIQPWFYAAALARTREQGGLLIVDSVQSGLRCYGTLSIASAPGFDEFGPPDVEVFAKAIHGGVIPASVVAVGDRAARQFRTGTYGCTTTSTPRQLEVMSTSLRAMTPDVAANVRVRGEELLQMLRDSCCPRLVYEVRGVGLLLAIQLRETVDIARAELALRQSGLNVVRGGENCIRLTPWFRITSRECRLIASVVRDVLGSDGALSAMRS